MSKVSIAVTSVPCKASDDLMIRNALLAHRSG